MLYCSGLHWKQRQMYGMFLSVSVCVLGWGEERGLKSLEGKSFISMGFGSGTEMEIFAHDVKGSFMHHFSSEYCFCRLFVYHPSVYPPYKYLHSKQSHMFLKYFRSSTAIKIQPRRAIVTDGNTKNINNKELGKGQALLIPKCFRNVFVGNITWTRWFQKAEPEQSFRFQLLCCISL